MPVAPTAAVIPGKFYHYSQLSYNFAANLCADNITEYGSVANVLDYTTAVIPVTRANKELDQPNPAYQPRNEVDKRNWSACKLSWSGCSRNSLNVIQMMLKSTMERQLRFRYWGGDSTKKSSCRLHSLLWKLCRAVVNDALQG